MTKEIKKSVRNPQLVLITGVSGAGKSSALGVFEDIGFEAIDNVPIPLLGRLINPTKNTEKLAVGVDIRTRDFDASTLLAKIESLEAKFGKFISILFMDCANEMLLRRFEETRRRHPLAGNSSIAEGLSRERILLRALQNRAHIILDTSDMTIGDLKLAVVNHYNMVNKTDLSIFITSFGFKNGLPRNSDLVLDVRFLKNPYYDLKLRPLDGRSESVGNFIKSDEGFNLFFDKLIELLDILLERYSREGKNYLTIAFGCTGGKHRSVFLAETLAIWFNGRNQVTQIRHRDL